MPQVLRSINHYSSKLIAQFLTTLIKKLGPTALSIYVCNDRLVAKCLQQGRKIIELFHSNF